MRTEGKPTAIHRDEEGEIHAVSAVCTHLDCIVQWNNAEGTWDCPCHGSRFGVDGDLIVGPAVEDLPQRNDEETIEANSEYESRLDSL
jgi:Rieske Fe-S protein